VSVPKATAGEFDRKIRITFGQPVEIPGLILPEGIYVFNFFGSTADRNLIDVLSQDEQKVYATIEAIPDYSADAIGETSLVFEQRNPNAPHAIKEWFFPDRRYGHVFVYPETGPLEIGKSNDLESEQNLVETPGLQSTVVLLNKNERTDAAIGHSEKKMQPEETDYLRVLHQKQAEALEAAKTGTSENVQIPAESPKLNYLQALHLKQTKELQRKQIAAAVR
jgi:hypothetical protein